jgi:uncharacterized membrane protein
LHLAEVVIDFERLQELSVRSLVLIVLLLTGAAAAQTPGFWLMGTASGTDRSYALGLSQDGAVAAGYSITSTPPYIAPGFRWTPGGGRYDFGLEAGMPVTTAASGISGDGNTIAGWMAASAGPTHAYRRTGSAPLEDLGPLLSYQRSYASDVSGDGSVVVGAGDSVIGGVPVGQAFRWAQQGGMQALGWLHGSGRISEANAISRDGTTIVGMSDAGAEEAFVWRQGTGMLALPPPGSGTWTGANGVNSDGAVIVGYAGSYAARWTSSGIGVLGTIAGSLFSTAYAVSDDGSIVGGSAAGGQNPPTAIVWTASGGLSTLSGYLAASGIGVPQGWRLQDVFAVSGDGRTFAGDAVSTSGSLQGFVATIPAPSGAILIFAPALLWTARRRRGG